MLGSQPKKGKTQLNRPSQLLHLIIQPLEGSTEKHNTTKNETLTAKKTATTTATTNGNPTKHTANICIGNTKSGGPRPYLRPPGGTRTDVHNLNWTHGDGAIGYLRPYLRSPRATPNLGICVLTSDSLVPHGSSFVLHLPQGNKHWQHGKNG